MHRCDGILRGRVVARPVELACPPGGLLPALGGSDAVMLESSALHPRYGRYSILACNPLEVLTLDDSLLRDRYLSADALFHRELGPDGENECFKVNGSLPGRIRNNKLSRRSALDERTSCGLSLE